MKYAIHPVAGRMPGHMNVLLAEADVPYEQLKEMDEINPDFPSTDVVLVVGANDVVNPAARSKGTPISGMPILNVDQAQSVVFLKRSMRPGFAGIDNELLYDPKTQLVTVRGKGEIDVATRVTLAHELTHALQDQHFDLANMHKVADEHHAETTARAVIEGDA